MEEFIPYKRLWSAVVIQAFRDLKDHDRTIRDRARNWIDDPQPVGEGGFKWICTCLDLDVEALRTMSLTRAGIDQIVYGKRNVN
jgi:hypothetical protein